jgi:hypothetical protein
MAIYEDLRAELAARDAARAVADRRLLTWLRREVNQDLRYWRHEALVLPLERRERLTADCKAKLALLKWAERWAGIRDPGYDLPSGRPDVEAAMLGHLQVVMGCVRRLAQGYAGRPGWRSEWELPS